MSPTLAQSRKMPNSSHHIATGLILTLTSAATAAADAPADRHPFGIDDYSALHSAHAVAVSPDGKEILYDLRTDGDKGVSKHEWRVIDVSGTNSSKLELPEKFKPSGFTREGALFGISTANKLSQFAIVPRVAGQPTLSFGLPNNIQTAVVAPDGKRFALLVDSRPKDALEDVHTVVENEEPSLYIVSATGGDGAWWCPDLKSITDIAWSRDAKRIAVITQVPKMGNHELRSTVSVCEASGSRRIAEIPNATSGIAWSADGKDIVFAATTTPTLTPEHVWSVPAAGGSAVDRTPQLEGTAPTVGSDPHGEVWVELHKGVITEVAAFRDGQFGKTFRWPGGVLEGLPIVTAFTDSPQVMGFSVEDPQHATNVAVENAGELKKITHDGDDTLSAIALGDVKVVHWTSKEGIKLEGIATFPPGYTPGTKYPFLVLPHGGPEANDTLNFDIFARLIAGMGYIVLQPQYRGSTGYGSDFLSAIYQHFGDRAYRDVDSATDFALAQGWADPNRLAIFGWSAGGFMTSWTVTQTNRYKAAIEGAGITDWVSFIPTSDTWQTDYDARLQEKDAAALQRFSAVMYAQRVTTPLLILHGEADVRVPTFQGREFYVLLKERGKTVRMVTYPGSPHFPELAEQRRDVFKEIQDWLKKYNP
jgi:dipeptidyl aminopeptidase/acylaminoacyl peptidase